MKPFVRSLLSVMLCLGGAAHAQINGATTGVVPFGTYTDDPLGLVNAANLNMHSVVPIRSKSGFSAHLQHESNALWQKLTNGPTRWTPILSNFRIITPTTNSGGLSYAGTRCGDGTDAAYSISSTDSQGFVHNYPSGVDTKGCTWPVSVTTTDSYGYTATANSVTGIVSITDLSGVVISYNSTTSTTLTDPHGNVLTFTSDGLPVPSWHFTDFTGATPLSASGTDYGARTYSYTDAAGATKNIVVTGTPFTVQSNFGCTGIGEFGPISGYYLTTNIALPDGSQYSFTYEPTPGHPSATTGRIASITMPSGGTVTYNYNGPNDGMTCSDGGTSGFTRTTSDGTWTYTRTFASGQWTTMITAPSGQKVTYLFTGDYYEVQRVYAEANGTVVSTIATCYNGNVALSTCATKTSISTIVPTETTVFTGLPNMNGRVSEVDALYNSSVLPTQIKAYDFGSGAAGALLRTTTNAYGSWNGSACVAVGVNIKNRICTTTVADGAGTTNAQVVNIYDAKGNLLTGKNLVAGSTFLSRQYTYNPNGTSATATDVNGTITTYSNYVCNAFLPGTISTSGLSVSATYDCNGGVQTSSTDPNGSVTTTDYTLSGADPFWRPKASVDPLGNSTNFIYQPNPAFLTPAMFDSYLTFGSSTQTHITYADPLGRKLDDQIEQAPGSSNLDTVSYSYDSNGRLNTVSVPCVGSFVTVCPTAATTTTYDALNRPLTLTDIGGGTTTYVYSNNDVLVSLAGGQTFQKQYEKDGLGRVTSVCEISSAAGSGTCGQVNSKQGFWTKYTYDAPGRLKTTMQNAQGTGQSRTFAYDGVGRLTSEVNPESGTTSYVYDTEAVCGQTSVGDLVKKTDANGNYTCYGHDSLHRVTYKLFYGPNAVNQQGNDYYVYDAATVNGFAMSNPKGRLVEAYTAGSPTGTKITDLGLSYAARGEVATVFESTPHSGGYYTLSAAYWPSGALHTLGGIGLPTITYSLDGEGRVASVSASSGQNPVTSVTYNVRSQITSVLLGSGDSVNNSFDANTGRQTSYGETINGTTISGTLTWNGNGTLNKLIVSDPLNTNDSQTCTYTYEDLMRLATASCGTAWSQTFSYDAFGNLSKSGSLTWQPGYNAANNRYTLGGTTYDSDGNLLTDTFHTYRWNVENRPTNFDTISLIHDALGRVVEKNTSGVYSQYVYDFSGTRIATMSGQTLAKGLVPLPGGIQATYDPTNSGYRVPDWLGTVRMASSSNRTYSSSRAFAPFGERYASGGSAPSSYTFTGMTSATVTDEYDFPARSLQTSQGRWISPDTSGIIDFTNPQSLNRYAYANNNPLLFTDPTGEVGEPCSPMPGGGGGGCDTSNNFPSLVNDPCALTFPPCLSPFEEWSAGTNSGNATGWLGTMAGYGTVLGNAWLTATAPIGKIADWSDQHPLITFPLAGLALLEGNSGPVEEDASIIEREGGIIEEQTARATSGLLDAIRAHGRTIITATEGSDMLRYLNHMGAEASVSGEMNESIILRENPSKAAALEEFLHGTQMRLGIIERLGIPGAEQHVVDFMTRHSRLLGLEQ